MNRLILFVGVIALCGAVAQASVIPSVTSRAVTGAESGNGAPAGGTVYEFFLDSTADILSVNDVVVSLTSGTIYQNALGTDNAAPNPAFVAVFPALGVDSFITTPGATAELGVTVGPTSWVGTWGDTSSDGAQSGFKFAQFTLDSSGAGTYSFDLAFAGISGPEEVNFSGTFGVIPEPASLVLLGLGGLMVVARRRRA